jgi:uncharacterized protein YkwD
MGRPLLAWSLAALLAPGALPAAAADLAQAAQLIVKRTNGFREEQKLPSLAVDAALEKAAQEFAAYMARTREYGHTADGRTPAERASAQGYDYCIVSENIGYVYRSSGYDTVALARELVEGWKTSPEHRKSMLDPAVTQVGIGVSQGEGERYFGVQLFGRPKSAAIRFSVRNDAGTKVDYRAGKQAYTLRPRAVRTHTVCRALELRITLPGKPAPFSAQAKDGARYTVAQGARGAAVSVDAAP